MTTSIFRAADRGRGDFGWLKPNYYFSFSRYQDPAKERFGLLRVLNDDYIAGGGAFPTHPHDNMEIITIPFSGALKHKDSTGGEGVIKAGDIQIMSAGTGVEHSEANASLTDPVTLFQVWIYPKENDLTPRYEQKHFDEQDRENKWQHVVSPRKEDGGLWINQDARFSMANLSTGNLLTYENAFRNNGVFLVVINGAIEVNGEKLGKRDAVGIEGIDRFEIKATEDAELLAIEVPMT